MVTGELRNKVDAIWETLWTGGISGPITVLEQITYLMFKPVFLQDSLQDRIITDYARIASGSTFAEVKIFTLKSCIRDYVNPMGTAVYKTRDEMPEKLRRALPSMEDLCKLL